jgi:hypothetical protein
MPVLRDIKFNLELDRVLQRQGYKDLSRVRPEVREMTVSLIDEAKSLGLIESAVTYEVYAVIQVDPDRITLDGGVALQGSLLPSRLSNARRLIIVVSTIGPRLEARVKEYTASKETLKGMLLDGIGSTAMHSMTQEACAVVLSVVRYDGHENSPIFSPGMAGFPLTEQATMLSLAKAETIGVTLTSSGTMVPRKSTSRVIGIGPRVTTLPV